MSGALYARLYNRIAESIGAIAEDANEAAVRHGDETAGPVIAGRLVRQHEEHTSDALFLDGDELDLGSDVLRLD